MTMCLSIGTLIAVAASFVATRFLPNDISRVEVLPYLFSASLFLSFVHSFLLKSGRRVMVQQAIIAAMLYIICPVYDLLQIITVGVTKGSTTNLLFVNLVLLLTSGFCLLFAYLKRGTSRVVTSERLDMVTE